MVAATSAEPTSADRIGLGWSIASLAMAIAASIALLFIPLLMPGFDLPEQLGPATPALAPTRQTVIGSAGFGGVLVLLWPIVITAVPLRLRDRPGVRGYRAIAALLLLPLLPIGSFAVGGFYVPSALAMAISSVRRKPAR